MVKCTQSNCPISLTGICLEGHQQGCPHLLPEGTVEVASQTLKPKSLTENIPAPKSIRFHSGEKLTVSEASDLLQAQPVRLVFCAGSQWSGKTTFLARIGEMFGEGTFDRYRFVASKTLCAFERISWLATLASGAERPDTERSRRSENDTFLHLRTHLNGDQSIQYEILISDLAGETFPEVVSSKEFCAGLRALNRADHLVVFLDCARLKDNAQRHAEWVNVQTFLQRVTEIRNHDLLTLHVQVIFSRYDYVVLEKQKDELEIYLKKLENLLKERFGKTFASLNFLRIAARPKPGFDPTNNEIQNLFGYWIETPFNSPKFLKTKNLHPVRDFSAFGLS